MKFVRTAVFILASSAACARHVPVPEVAKNTAQISEAVPKEPYVEVRNIPSAPTVSVVAWYRDDAAYGIRGTLRRDGALVRDHQFYVSTNLRVAVGTAPGYVQTIVPSNKSLPVLGVSRDEFYCFGNSDSCSPVNSIRVRVADEILRANRDSIAVRFFDNNKDLILTLRRDLLDGYLRAVDSLSTAMARR